jgi:hypothetical protein
METTWMNGHSSPFILSARHEQSKCDRLPSTGSGQTEITWTNGDNLDEQAFITVYTELEG